MIAHVRIWRRIAPLLLSGVLSGCGPAGGVAADAPDHAAAMPASVMKPVAPASLPAGMEDLAARYTADLTQAVAGARKVPFPAKGGFGGMTCTPATVAGTSAASRALTLTLPVDAAARAHVLAVVTPVRGMLELYTPHDGEAADDLVIPSFTISWDKARTRNGFPTTSDAMSGLRPGRDRPETLFLEAGRYRFALVNGIDPALLAANGGTVVVSAACSFDWTPGTATDPSPAQVAAPPSNA